MSPPPLPPDPYATYPASAPGGGPAGRAGLRAAIAMWVTSSLFLIFSTCCVGGIAIMGAVPLDQIKQEMGESDQIPAEMWDQIGQVQPFMPVVAAVLALFTVLPAIVMLVLGFWVKNGSRGATITAMVFSIIALVGVGLMLLGSVASMVTTGQFDLCGTSLFMGLAAGFVWCVLSLKKALAQTRPRGDVFQPMHQHPTPAPGSPGSPGNRVPGNYGRSPDDDPWENSL